MLFSFPSLRAGSWPPWPVLGAAALLLSAEAAAQPSAESLPIGAQSVSYPVPTAGEVRYVKPDGDNSADGKTLATAWRTLGKAITSAPDGATVVFKGGTYRASSEGVGMDRRLILQPYLNDVVWFKGSVTIPAAEWKTDGSTRWVKNNWTYQLPRDPDGASIDQANAPLAGYTDMVYLNGNRLVQVATKAEVGPGKFYVDYGTQQLYLGDNPSGKTVEATAYKRGMSVVKNPANSFDPSGSVVRGLGFAHFAEAGLGIGDQDVTVEDCTFAWNGQNGLVFFGQNNPSGAVLRYNRFAYNGMAGASGGRANNALVAHNRFDHNNVENFNRFWSAAGFKLTTSDNVVLRDNVAEDNNSTGFWLDVDCRNATIIRNTARRNTAFGIFFEVSRGALIASNLSVGNSTGIAVSNSRDARLYNNTLVSNGRALLVNEGDRTPSAAEKARGADYRTRGTVLKNNLIAKVTGSTAVIESYRPCSDTAQALVTAMDFNAYYRTAANQPAKFAHNWVLAGSSQGCFKFPLTLQQFQELTGLERNGLAIDGGPGEPFLVNAAADGTGNYRLKPGSLAYRRGEPLPAGVAAALGVPAGVAVDLGYLFDAGSYGNNVPTVTSITLINADTDQPIAAFNPLGDGATLNLAKLPTRRLSIRANTTPADIGSVRFGLDGNANFRVENSVPYALAGDNPGPDYGAWTPSLGPHTLTVTPYSQAGASGTAGPARTFTFTVVESLVDNPGFEAGGQATGNPAGWSTTSAGGHTNADYTQAGTPHGGRFHAVHFKNTAYDVYTSQLIENLPDGLYTFRAWVRVAGGYTGSRLQVENHGGSTLTKTLPSTNWQWAQVSLPNINVTSGRARIGFYTVAGASQGIQFDDVEFVRQPGASTPAARQSAGQATSEAGAAEVVFYPVPVVDKLTIDLPGAKGEELVEVVVTTTLGQQVLARTLPLNGARTLVLDLGHLSNGIYTVTVLRGGLRRVVQVPVAH
ncbi:right-handed parallel beta-helix repeat-containing protein [Hymenobacter weizhouensis]|uniref:right-handed parallel beta-helix repeat-containing protein n=1 Tax=Hymenobacter sp. YIM 151500-1 TaxID=2987689 RepID=UPI0022262D8E|nr:right-handed parallel beta-helix repeat-containing protein [Hymenobacter sp. YIM 151500-1]UYZ62501.1 right-handed parallel beta-helix repeat-containing protein [Hymenobacter sp. YIM 151500-1]